MKNCKCYAIATDPIRHKEWEAIFYNGHIPIISPIPSAGTLVGQEALFYLIDFDRVSYAEKENMISFLANKFDLAPVEVRKDIETRGAPVKAEGLTLSICKIHGLAMMPDYDYESEDDFDEAHDYTDDEEPETYEEMMRE